MPHTSKEFRESWLDEKILMSNYFPWKQNQLVSVQSRFNDEPIHNSQAQQKNTENYHPSPPVLHRKQKPKAQPQQKKKKNLINIAESIYIELGILILEPGLSFQQQLF